MKGEAYGRKADIWALGIAVYRLMTYRYPFDGNNILALADQIITGEFAPIDGDYSQDLKEAIYQMLRGSEDQRPSAGELIRRPLFRERLETYQKRSIAGMEQYLVEGSSLIVGSVNSDVQKSQRLNELSLQHVIEQMQSDRAELKMVLLKSFSEKGLREVMLNLDEEREAVVPRAVQGDLASFRRLSKELGFGPLDQ